jgi:TRAP-type C4-dicarboxylate transport system permease small subunit
LVLGVADRVQRETEAVAGRSGGRAPALATSQQTWALAATGLIASAMSFTLPIAWLTTTDGLIWAAGSGILNYALPFGLYLAALRHLQRINGRRLPQPDTRHGARRLVPVPR